MLESEQALVKDIKKALSKLKLKTDEVILELVKEDHIGDLCTSIACQLASKYKLNSAKELADNIVNTLKNNKYIAAVKAENNGFINLVLSNKAFGEYYESLFTEHESIPKSWKYLEVVSANPTGYLHIGHTRHGILTDTLGNIFEKVGYSVRREYLINDAGNQIKELLKSFWKLWQSRRRPHLKLEQKEIDAILYKGVDMQECLDYLWHRYRDRWKDEEDDIFKCNKYKEIREEVLNYFLEEIKRLLDKYQIKVDIWRKESDIVNEGSINRLIRNMNDRLIYKDGASWLDIGDDKEEVIIKSTGEHTYFMQDAIYHDLKLGLIGSRDEIVNVLGCDHYGHIDKLMGYIKARGKGEEGKVNCICMQLVKLLENGESVKMSKRDSTAIHMRDLENYMTYEEVRWFFISQPATSTLEIDIEKIKNKDYNNPVYYVMYAYSRIYKILEKANSSLYLNRIPMFDDLSSKERRLFNLVMHFDSVLTAAAKHYAPHKLTQYLFKLAQAFHAYYEDTQILGSDRVVLPQRLALLESIKRVIKEGLSLMRIEVRSEL